MDSQGNLTYPKPGFTVTDSRGLAPHSPLRQTAAGESISLYRFRWYYITYIFKMQVFFISFLNYFHMYKKSAVSVAYLRRRKFIFLFSLSSSSLLSKGRQKEKGRKTRSPFLERRMSTRAAFVFKSGCKGKNFKA